MSHSDKNRQGWTWFDQNQAQAAPEKDIAAQFARCFKGDDGDQLLAHLAEMTMGRPLGANTRNDTLRHVEGQRYLVSYIMTMVRKGREG